MLGENVIHKQERRASSHLAEYGDLLSCYPSKVAHESRNVLHDSSFTIMRTASRKHWNHPLGVAGISGYGVFVVKKPFWDFHYHGYYFPILGYSLKTRTCKPNFINDPRKEVVKIE